jgi:hypothetical protein
MDVDDSPYYWTTDAANEYRYYYVWKVSQRPSTILIKVMQSSRFY